MSRDDSPVIDPVTGFPYPPEWVEACGDASSLAMVKSGLAVLTSGGTVRRRGYTTGTTAAAACHAAILSLRRPVECVRIRVPCGLVLDITARGEMGHAQAEKYAGDYPGDATAGIVFDAVAVPSDDGITLTAGSGIGRFERDTPRQRKGEPAISRAALQGIMDAVTDALRETGFYGVDIALSAPGGEAVAARTLNPTLGIRGGISVLGTTGLVEPWDDHVTESVLERIGKAERLVITTGRIGLRHSRLLFPDHEVVLAGSGIREALARARGEVILCGLPGLILKFFSPHILDGTGCLTVEELSAMAGFDRMVAGIFRNIRGEHPGLRVVILSREGRILGDSG